MTVCDICHQLTMDSITICNECRRELQELDCSDEYEITPTPEADDDDQA